MTMQHSTRWPEPPARALNAAPGWYPSLGILRYWDGTEWTQHTAPLTPARPAPAQITIHAHARVRQPRKYVTRGVSGTEHLLHVVLCFVTLGVWLPVYLLRCLAGRHRQVAKY